MLNSWCHGLGYRTGAALPRLAAALVVVWGLFAGANALAQEHKGTTLRVAAASDLQPVMPALAFGYEKKTGVKVVASFGSSSTLAEQIVNGAPFDVFLGADFTFPEKLTAAGLTTAPPARYAKGSLVLFARKDSAFNPLHLEALTDPRVTRIAVADQFHAPYGRAAYAALDKLKMMPQVQSKLVVAENISQTAQFVLSGNAQLGLISETVATSPAMKKAGIFVLVPDVYPDILQYGVAMKGSPHRAEAEDFLQWMGSEEVQSHMKEYGLDPVR